MEIRKIMIAVLVATVAVAIPAAAEDEEKLGWENTAELSFVVTSGNADSETFGFKAESIRSWESSSLEFKAGAVRAQQTTVDRLGISADPNDPTVPVFVQELETTDTTAEIYYLKGRYNKDVTKRLFWFAGAGWDRNRPAGIENRYVAEGGVGNLWYDRDDLKFRTDYALTYTDREDVVLVPDRDDAFAGLRFSWKYMHKFGASTKYTNDLVLDYNLEESSDWRGDMINALSVAMSERLAIKVGLQWLYANQPAFEDVVVAGSDPERKVPFELDSLDSIFTTSLVITF